MRTFSLILLVSLLVQVSYAQDSRLTFLDQQLSSDEADSFCHYVLEGSNYSGPLMQSEQRPLTQDYFESNYSQTRVELREFLSQISSDMENLYQTTITPHLDGEFSEAQFEQQFLSQVERVFAEHGTQGRYTDPLIPDNAAARPYWYYLDRGHCLEGYTLHRNSDVAESEFYQCVPNDGEVVPDRLDSYSRAFPYYKMVWPHYSREGSQVRVSIFACLFHYEGVKQVDEHNHERFTEDRLISDVPHSCEVLTVSLDDNQRASARMLELDTKDAARLAVYVGSRWNNFQLNMVREQMARDGGRFRFREEWGNEGPSRTCYWRREWQQRERMINAWE